MSATVGRRVGFLLGLTVGFIVGFVDGAKVGYLEGLTDGMDVVGFTVGFGIIFTGAAVGIGISMQV